MYTELDDLLVFAVMVIALPFVLVIMAVSVLVMAPFLLLSWVVERVRSGAVDSP